MVDHRELQGIGLRCLTDDVWATYQCSPFAFSESQEAVQFTGGSPPTSRAPVRVALYAKFSTADFGRRAIWDHYDKATN